VPITEQHTEESLCFAHIYALAGIAGVNYSAHRYDYGIDGQFTPVTKRGNRLIDSGFPLDYQAKATIDWELKNGKIVYDLEAKNSNDLVSRTAAETSIILILLCLPKQRANWHSTSYDQTVLRNCCYWHTINGAPKGPCRCEKLSRLRGSPGLLPLSFSADMGRQQASCDVGNDESQLCRP
jgi:hypothetical protein